MPGEPSVSVVITTFNRTEFLRQAMSSVRAQTFVDFEVIVSDDAGSNDVVGILSEFGDDRFRYRRNPKRLGLAGNTLAASLEARGTYLSYLNDDDIWDRNFLATMVGALEANHDVVLAFSDHHIMDGHGEIDPKATEKSSRSRGREGLAPGIHRSFARIGLIQRGILMGLSAVLRRREVDWDDFPPEVGCYADCWITYLAWRTGLAAYYEPRRLTFYRRHSQAMTRVDTSPCALAGAYCYGRFLQDPALRDLRSELASRRARILVAPVIDSIKEQDPSHARERARLALRTHFSPSTLTVALLTLMPNTALEATGSLVNAVRKEWPGLPRPLG
jgi:hypothetical protein